MFTCLFLLIMICSFFLLGNLNLVQTLLLLIGITMLIAISCFFSGSDIIGIFLIMVYIGAIAMLFLFVLMLAAIKVNSNKQFQIKSIGFLYFLCFSFLIISYNTVCSENILQLFSWSLQLKELGVQLFSEEYALFILLIGLLLLAILIGILALAVEEAFQDPKKKDKNFF